MEFCKPRLWAMKWVEIKLRHHRENRLRASNYQIKDCVVLYTFFWSFFYCLLFLFSLMYSRGGFKSMNLLVGGPFALSFFFLHFWRKKAFSTHLLWMILKINLLIIRTEKNFPIKEDKKSQRIVTKLRTPPCVDSRTKIMNSRWQSWWIIFLLDRFLMILVCSR